MSDMVTEHDDMGSVEQRVQSLIHADLPSRDDVIPKCIWDIIGESDKYGDMEKRIAGKSEQSINAYHELMLGSGLLAFSQDNNYKLEYERQFDQLGRSAPDWTISSDSESVLIEVVSKHNSNVSRIKEAIVSLICSRFNTLSVNYSRLTLPAIVKEKPDYAVLQSFYQDLVFRIEQWIKVSAPHNSTTCIEGIEISLSANSRVCCMEGSIPSRYLQTICEKAVKFDRFAQSYPLIIAVMSKSFLSGGALPPRMMTEILYGTYSGYCLEQMRIDHDCCKALAAAQPSIGRIAGILYCDLDNYNMTAMTYEYFPNPHKDHEGDLYNEIEAYFKSNKQSDTNK